MQVLVAGATGFVGRRLVPLLVAAGHDVVTLVRDPGAYDPPEGVRIVTGDLLDAASLDRLPEVEAVYYLVHSMRAREDFENHDRRAAENFAAAASAAGVERVVYLGGLGEERDHLSAHLRSRREVERVLATGDYALTTLRAAIIVGAGSAGFEMIRQLASRLPVMVTPRWVQTRCQPIAVAGVIASLVGVLDAPETAGETYEIGGPEVLTYAEMPRRTARHMGHEAVIIAVPVLTPRLSAYWVGLMTDVPWSVARPLIAGLKNPVGVHDDRIRGVVAVDPTPFDDAVRQALGEASTAT